MTTQQKIDFLQRIIDKDSSLVYEDIVIKAMSQAKSVNYLKRVEKIANPLTYIDSKKLSINPNASGTMRGLWKSLGLESDVLTGAKEESFSTPVLKELVKTTFDESTREIIQQVLDIGSTKNLLSQYIPACELNYTGEGTCFLSVRFPGTKSYRISGKTEASGTGLSMVTIPKIIKTAIVAPKGWLIACSDYAALESVISCNLTHDATKLASYKENFDGHCLAATTYFPDEIGELLGTPANSSIEFNKLFNKERKENTEKGKKLDKLRSSSKGVTFGLEYGSYPPKVAKQLSIPLKEAEGIFNRFHYELYKGVSIYREEYVLKTALKNGKIHLGFGAFISTKNANKDIRTLTNSTFQFYSILTLIAIVKIQKRIKEAGYEQDILVYATCHDEISAMIKEEVKVIKWYNDNLIGCMTKSYLVNQNTPLTANLDIGRVYTEAIELPNNCSEEYIQEVLNQLK